MKNVIIIIALSLLTVMNLNAQESQDLGDPKTKKELKAEKKAAKKKEQADYKAYGMALLESKNFVMKVDRMQNARGGRVIPTVPTVNFIKIDGEDVTVQFGNVADIGLNGVGGVTYNGKLQKFESFDRGEGKSAGASIQYTSIYARNVITLYIEISGEQVTARFNENGTIINMYGQYEPFEGTSVWEGSNRRDF
jgi:hypothetical protein